MKTLSSQGLITPRGTGLFLFLLLCVLTLFTKGQLTVLSPNGGETYAPGTHHWIYTTNGWIKYELSTDNGLTWSVLDTAISSFEWTIPNTPSTACRIRATDVFSGNSDISDNTFTIGGVAGAAAIINFPDTFVCNGTSLTIHASGTPAGGTFRWTLGYLGLGPFTSDSTSADITLHGPFPNCESGCTYILHLLYSVNGFTDTVFYAAKISFSEAHLVQIDTVPTCNGASVRLQDSVSYFLLPPPDLATSNDYLVYQWSDGDTSYMRPFVTSGTYQVTATNYKGCSSVYTIDVNGTNPVAQISSASGGPLPDVLTASATGGVPPYNYQWSNGAQGSSISLGANDDGGYWVTVTDNSGCTASQSILAGCTGQCVWPGDCDYDGKADNNDLLAIGLGYNVNGNLRVNPTISWTAQLSGDWTDTLSTGTNFKHIDCNGNGVIDADDTTAIVLNYNLLHPKSASRDSWRSGAPLLLPVVEQDTVANGDTITVHLLLGDSLITASNVYGLAFTLTYNAEVIDTSKTSIVFGNSWLGSANEKISIAKDLPSVGQIQCALTRIDHTPRSGAGEIGTAQFVITTDNINGKNLAYYNAGFQITNVTLIDNLGNELQANAGRDTVLIEYEPTAVNEIPLDKLVHVYPNPTHDQFTISADNISLLQINILNLLGESVVKQQVSDPQLEVFNVSQFKAGVYLLEIITDKGRLTKRLIVTR